MNKNTLLAFLGGVIAGGFAALLLAPKSGEETREFLAEKIKSSLKRGEQHYDEICEKIQELKSNVANKLNVKEV